MDLTYKAHTVGGERRACCITIPYEAAGKISRKACLAGVTWGERISSRESRYPSILANYWSLLLANPLCFRFQSKIFTALDVPFAFPVRPNS